MWRLRLRVLPSQKSQEIHVIQEVQEVVGVVRVISDEEGGCLVPVWITSTGLLFNDSAQTLQEENCWCSLWCGKSYLVPTWIAKWRLLLGCFCAEVKRGESSCNCGKEFLCSSVVFYIRTGSLLFYTDVAREGGSSREEGSCKNPFETRWFLI